MERSRSETNNPALIEVHRIARTAVTLSAIFSLAINLLMLSVPIYMLQVFDRVLSSRSVETLIMLSLITLVALSALGALDVARNVVLTRLGAWTERKLGGYVIGATVIGESSARSDTIQGIRDLATIRSFLGGSGPTPLLDFPWTPVFIAVVFMLHPILGHLAITGALLLAALALGHERLTRGTLRGSAAASARVTREAEAAIHNADVIQAMGMLPAIVRRWQQRGTKTHARQLRASRQSAAINGLAKALRMALQMAVLGIGALLVIRGELTGGAMIAASILMGRALAPIEMAISGWRTAVGVYTAYKRVRASFSRDVAQVNAMALPTPRGRLSVENATYVYPGQVNPTLRGIRCELGAGELLAVVGPAGAGKSTLARLLVGNIPARFGHVRLDSADITQWPLEQRQQHIGFLPQDVELFAGTVRENIARMEQQERGVVAAAQLVGAHDMILSLPRGYDTEIGVGGVSLSGGQRQWIALARAVYGDPRFLVLDEPNASLDQAGDAALLRALLTLKERGTTTIVISHRPNVLQIADHILVLQQGQVRTVGPRQTILPQLIGPATAAS